MKFEDIERQTFEEFGEMEVYETTSQQIDIVANDVTPEDIDVVANDIIARDEQRAVVEPVAPPPLKTGFSWPGFAGGLAALVWIGGAIGGPLSYYGIDAVMAMDPAVQAGLIALAFGPAVLFWLAASAAGEALKARRLATELTRIAYQSRTPFEVGESHVERLSLTVRTEIEALNDAVASALNRLAELESVAHRNTSMFDNAIAATRENASLMADHLSRERNALMDLNSEMRGQTETMAQSIGRQIRLMREASKLVKTEISAAEDALETHLASFAASATVMSERTSSFHDVAHVANDATASLNGTMSQMLDGLGEATRLTDAARKSSEQAVLAANETASAVRETTRHAVFEAKRAAQLIRAETVAMQDAAAETLSQLQSAAQAAREASEESQAAADRHSASLEKRLSALAATAGASKKQPQPQPRPEPRPEPRLEVKQPARNDDAHIYEAAARAQQPRNEEAPRPSRVLKGLGGWGNFMPHARDLETPTPANRPEEVDAFDLVDFGDKNPDAELKNDAIDLVSQAGVDLDDVLRPSDLEQIATQSRHGAVARRRAVSDAAGSAVNRIARHVKRDSNARLVAAEFRARPDLAKSDKKGEGRNLVRAYLLIDAALA